MTFVLLAVLVAVGDIFLKNHFEKELQWGEERRICGGKVLLCRYHNRGVALNVFEKRPGIIKYFCGGMLLFLGIIWFLISKKKKNLGIRLGLSLLTGGGAGNLYDRVTRGYVVDYFSFQTSWNWLNRIVFNLSDLAIFLGAFLVSLKGKSFFGEER